MESKRKAVMAAADLMERTPKRLKSESSSHPLLLNGETPETTTQYGLRFLENVKKTQDKSKRMVATDFLKLPNKRELPEYYQFTKLPIAIDTMENKLRRRAYPTLDKLESDFKRMVQNARRFNEKGSTIYDDAERLRKVLSTYMKENNPAYKRDPNHVVQATPVPGEVPLPEDLDHDSDMDAEGEPDEEVLPSAEPDELDAPDRRGKGSRPRVSIGKVNGQRASTTPASENRFGGRGFAGLNLSQAQEKVVVDLQNLTEDNSAYLKFEVFKILPDKSLKDYYKVIPNPMSLRTLFKRVRSGKEEGTPYKTWKSFEEEASLIWKNACHYNEDGSPIFNLALEFKDAFIAILAEAKQDVPDQQKILLKLHNNPREPTPTTGPQKIMLRLGGRGTSPAVSPMPPMRKDPTTANGMLLDGAVVNGMHHGQPFAVSQSSTPVPYSATPNRATSLSASVASPSFPPAVPFKREDVARPSPTSTAFSSTNIPTMQHVQTQSFMPNSSVRNLMPPPTTPGLSNSYSPAPPSNLYGQNHGQNFPQSSYNQNPIALHSKWRLPGKNESDALITKVSLATHPDLNISRHMVMDVLPSPTMSHQSVTINLPYTHYYMHVKPIVAGHVVNRQHKLFLTVNGSRLQSVPNVHGGVIDRESQAFVARLDVGVNRIEVEVIAALPKGMTKDINGADFELERFTIFANLGKKLQF